MNDVSLGLGTNLGDRIANLRNAIAALEPYLKIEKKSSVYESVPHGVSGEQPLYLNMAVHGTTKLSPHDLLRELKIIETNMERKPDTHNLPRPIDLDILLFGDRALETPELVIPHPRMHQRAFVLVPLEEIASFHTHPTLRKPVVDLLDMLGAHDTHVWRAEEQL